MKEAFAQAARTEKQRLLRSDRFGELRAFLSRVGEVGEGFESEVPIGDVIEGFHVGPYYVTMLIKSHGVAIDLDAHQSPVNRALRRRQWESLSGSEVRIAEISLSHWDRLKHDDRERILLIQRRIEGVDDPEEDDDDDF